MEYATQCTLKGGVHIYIHNCYVVLHMTCTTAYEMKLNDAVDGIPQQNVRTQSIRKHKRWAVYILASCICFVCVCISAVWYSSFIPPSISTLYVRPRWTKYVFTILHNVYYIVWVGVCVCACHKIHIHTSRGAHTEARDFLSKTIKCFLCFFPSLSLSLVVFFTILPLLSSSSFFRSYLFLQK